VDEIDQRCQELQGEVNQLLSLNKALNEELQALRDAQPDSVNVTGLLSRSTATHIQDFLDQDTQDSIASQPNPPTSQTVVSSASVGLQEAAASTPGPLASTPSKQPMKRTSSETAASGQSAGDLNAMSNFFAQLQS
jgi:E3 ubiquitin-protein ligase DOA10